MANVKQCKLRYLPLFWDDLDSAVSYIDRVLHNRSAAARLVDQVEAGILSHRENPTFASVYKESRTRKDVYYWFPVGNYMVFYVVIGDVMEVRRFLYGARDLTKVLP